MPQEVPPDDADRVTLPPRNTDWESPFAGQREVNADLDATHEVLFFSARRRKWAIAVSVVLALWVIGEIVHVIDLATPSTAAETDPYGIFNYGVIFFRLGVGGLITWRVWKWANQPVENESD